MRAHRFALPLILALLAPAVGHAEEATIADPEHYAVDFENESVRVLRIRYGPREKSVMHEHPRPGLLVYLTHHRVRFTLPDGSTEEVQARPGQTAWVEAATHLPENLSDEPLELLYLEIKPAPTTVETGDVP